jgi:hypothetical protein
MRFSTVVASNTPKFRFQLVVIQCELKDDVYTVVKRNDGVVTIQKERNWCRFIIGYPPMKTSANQDSLFCGNPLG